VQQELIEDFHRNSIWPAVVSVDGNISKHNKTDYIVRDGSYIILIPDGDFKSFQAEMNGLVQEGENKFRRLWNSESRFVVAGASKFSTLQQTAIFDYFSKLRIYNCIIVSQEHDALDNQNSKLTIINDVDAVMKLSVYTWFPYRSSDCCTEVNDITLLDSWVISAQEYFTKNTDLFPVKIRNSFNRCPMKAVVRNTSILLEVYYINDNVSSESDIGGFEMDILRIILKQMNMTFVYVPTPEGFELEDESVNNLVSIMIAKEAFIALGGVKRELSFYNSFDLTNSYSITRIRWYVPCSEKYPRWSSIFRILSVELWLILIISIVVALISTTLIGRYSCTPEWQSYKTLTSAFTHLWAVILGVSVSTMPRTPSLRSLFISWVCFSVAFNTVFQAFLTSFLTNSGYKTPIHNMDELFASGMKFAYHPQLETYYNIGDETEVSNIYRKLVNCPTYSDCTDWARYNNNVSILLFEEDAEMLYSLGDFVGENSKPLVCKLENGVVFTYAQTMLMFHGDPLMRRVNEIVDRVFEAGLYIHWRSLLLSSFKATDKKIAIVQQLNEYYSFSLYHMQTTFYLLLMGWCLSALCFMVEVLYNRCLSKIL
jgi:hypothetical protein